MVVCLHVVTFSTDLSVSDVFESAGYEMPMTCDGMRLLGHPRPVLTQIGLNIQTLASVVLGTLTGTIKRCSMFWWLIVLRPILRSSLNP
jgi:hypothetical protein